MDISGQVDGNDLGLARQQLAGDDFNGTIILGGRPMAALL